MLRYHLFFFVNKEQYEKAMENIVLKKTNKTSKAKVRLSHDQGPCVVGGFVWINETLQTRVLTGPPHRKLFHSQTWFPLHIILLTHGSCKTLFP